MKVNKKLDKRIQETLLKIDNLTRHIKNVQDNCLLLGERLIKSGEIELGRKLIANGFIHDNSKFYGLEWQELINTYPNQHKLKIAIEQHQFTNFHHVQYWGGINNMPEIYLAELCCDAKARSEEFGTDIKEWINNMHKEWKMHDDVYKKIMYFIDQLCEKPFI